MKLKDIKIGKVAIKRKNKRSGPYREVVLYMSHNGKYYYKTKAGNKIYVTEVGVTKQMLGRGKHIWRSLFKR